MESNYLAAYLEDGKWHYELENVDSDVIQGTYGTAGEALSRIASVLGITIVDSEVSEEFGHESAVFYFDPPQ